MAEAREMVRRRGNVTGPTLTNFMRSATWATEQVKTGEKGRPAYKISKAFSEEWYIVGTPACVVHKDLPDLMYPVEHFNKMIRDFSHVEDTAKLLACYPPCKIDFIEYDPRAKTGEHVREGRSYVNTYRPSSIVAKRGDASPFEKFMEQLIPNGKDRLNVTKWISTLACRPEVRMRYGILMISETQGVGKGTLGASILAHLVGRHNTSFPTEQMLIDSPFNYWKAHKRLIVVHEIYAGHSMKGYNTTKSFITDDDLVVNRKYLDEYTVDNWGHVYACSNSWKALDVAEADRRWLIPEVSEVKEEDPNYWITFYKWLNNGGLPIIKWWMEDFLRKHGAVNTSDHAPDSDVKMEIISDSRSEAQRFGYDVAEKVLGDVEKERALAKQQGREPDPKKVKVVLVAAEVADLYNAQARRNNDQRFHPERPRTFAASMVKAGMSEIPTGRGEERKRVHVGRPSSKRLLGEVLATFPLSREDTWETLKDFYQKPQDFSPF